MGKRTRRAFNRAANWLEDASERAVTWLRAKGERKRRQRPLVFPSPLWLMMEDMNRRLVEGLAAKIVADMASPQGNRLMRALSEEDSPHGY